MATTRQQQLYHSQIISIIHVYYIYYYCNIAVRLYIYGWMDGGSVEEESDTQ